MTTNPIGGGLVRVLPVPPAGDTRVRVDFVRLNYGVAKSTTVGEYETSSLLNFDFSAEPLAGKFKLCGYCSGSFWLLLLPYSALHDLLPACDVFCGS